MSDGDIMENGDCVCQHLAHPGENCPEQVRCGGLLQMCGCDDYVPSRWDWTGCRDGCF